MLVVVVVVGLTVVATCRRWWRLSFPLERPVAAVAQSGLKFTELAHKRFPEGRVDKRNIRISMYEWWLRQSVYNPHPQGTVHLTMTSL